MKKPSIVIIKSKLSADDLWLAILGAIPKGKKKGRPIQKKARKS